MHSLSRRDSGGGEQKQRRITGDFGDLSFDERGGIFELFCPFSGALGRSKNGGKSPRKAEEKAGIGRGSRLCRLLRGRSRAQKRSPLPFVVLKGWFVWTVGRSACGP